MSDKKTIMVVEDDPDMTEIVRIILEGEGYNVVCAPSGPDFFSQIKGQKPDLIVLDVMLPDMDGLEVLRRVRGDDHTSSIPVVMLTIKDQYDDIQRAYELGCDYYLPKPFTRKQMVDTVNLLLSHTRPPS